MTKELSKQLCKLCGVELHPEKLQSKDPRFWQDNPEINMIYPDFGKPNNLYELMNLDFSYNLKKTKLMKVICRKSEGIWIYKPTDYINIVIKFIQNPSEFATCENVANNIKQAIKNAEWEY